MLTLGPAAKRVMALICSLRSRIQGIQPDPP